MEKACGKRKCTRQIAVICNCQLSPVYFCKKHCASHLLSEGNHSYQPILTYLNPERIKYAQINTAITKQYFAKMIATIHTSADILIQHIIKESNKAIQKTRILEKELLLLFKNINLGKCVDKVSFEKLKNQFIPSETEFAINKNMTEKSISEIFSFEKLQSQIQCMNNEEIFYFNANNRHLYTININNGDSKHHIAVLENVQDGYGFCQLPDNNIFLYGSQSSVAIAAIPLKQPLYSYPNNQGVLFSRTQINNS